MRYTAMILAVLACACASPMASTGIDPSVLIINQTSADTVFFSWTNGQAISGADTVLAGVTKCEHFTAQADSASFHVISRFPNTVLTQAQSTSTLDGPYFDPIAHPSFRLVVTQQGYISPTFVADIPPAPCS